MDTSAAEQQKAMLEQPHNGAIQSSDGWEWYIKPKQRSGKQSGKKNVPVVPCMENEVFRQYYIAQRVVPQAEFDAFYSILQTPLPVAVRINDSKSCSRELRARIASSGKFSAIEWFPHDLAWQCESKLLCTEPGLKSELDAASAGGFLSFQEAVSMIPPLLLDIKPEHLVLDICAAPGSKTMQCLDMMHTEVENSDEPLRLCHKGVVIANDIDTRFIPGCRTKKLGATSALITIGNAGKFPPLFEEDPSSPVAADAPPVHKQLLYDRIVCDVPCSGDGTMRKNPEIWRTWEPEYPLKLHVRQLKILLRALHHLKEGGVLSYSTCSLNPIENEAVVLAALRALHPAVAVCCPPEHLQDAMHTVARY
eukprot:gene26573-32625_t